MGIIVIIAFTLFIIILFAWFDTKPNNIKNTKSNNIINAKSIIEILRDDITKINVECIVNASNPSGLGCNIPNHCIDSAIHLRAGPELFEECKNLDGIPTGIAKLTKGYNLFAKYIIHCTGPQASIEDKNNNNYDWNMLATCYINILNIAKKYNIKEIAFCCISTGLYGYPKDKAAKIAYDTVTNWINDSDYYFDKIIFVVFTDDDRKFYTDIHNNT